MPRPTVAELAEIPWGGEGPDPLGGRWTAYEGRRVWQPGLLYAIPPTCGSAVVRPRSREGRRGRHPVGSRSSRGSPDREDDPEPARVRSLDGLGPAAWYESPEDRLLAYWALRYVGLSELERNTLFDVKENLASVADLAASEGVGEATIRQRVARALTKADRWLSGVGYAVPSRMVQR